MTGATDNKKTNVASATKERVVLLNVSTTVVPGMSRVLLYQHTWQEHILAGHPEVNRVGIKGIEVALSAPTSVHQSTSQPADSVVSVNENATSSGLYLLVPVKRLSSGTGIVKTAILSAKSYKGEVIGPDADA